MHRNRLRLPAAALALLAALAGCAEPDPVGPAGGPGRVLVDGSSATVRTDPATVVSAEVRGDRLHLEVTFGGGCREHSFALYGDGVFLESSPVQTGLLLAHDADGDNCRALLHRELEFDLGPLKERYRDAYGASGGTIVLRLHAPGAAEPYQPLLRYDF